MRRWALTLATAACLACSPGCGGEAQQARSSPLDREWVANIAGVIEQLRRDVAVEAGAPDTVEEAQRMLHDGLYTALVAYTDFGGCRHMVAAAGAAPSHFDEVTRSLKSACARLQRAAALFTRAATANDATALVRAGKTAQSASPLLDRAHVALQTATAKGR